MRIICVTNQKGGCGKTTTAINLSASLAANGRKVLLIDLDPQAHATLGLNVKSELSIYNVLSKLTNRKVRLEDIIKNVDTNFDLAPSSLILSTLEQELAGEISRESRLWETLQNFKGNYDYIIIDCPPNLGILTINAVRASNEVIIPVEASRFSLEGLSQLAEILTLVRERLNHDVQHKILVNNFDSRLRHSFKLLDYIRQHFKGQLFSTIIHVNVKLKEAQSQGTHIFNYDKYCRGAKDYFSLSREIILQEPESMKKVEQEMKRLIKEKLPSMAEVVFTYNSAQAKEVYVAGDFNNWRLDDTSRMEQENGTFRKRIKLRPGRYRYRFVVDGQWIDDPNNQSKEMNPYGQMDSLLEVKTK